MKHDKADFIAKIQSVLRNLLILEKTGRAEGINWQCQFGV